jgi:AraC-like DNA-binding protein
MEREPPLDVCTKVHSWRCGDPPLGLGFWPDLVYRQKIAVPALTVVEDQFNLQWVCSGELRLESADGGTEHAAAGSLCGLPPGLAVRKLPVGDGPVELAGLCFQGVGARGYLDALGFTANRLALHPANPDACAALFGSIESLFAAARPRNACRLAALLFQLAEAVAGGPSLRHDQPQADSLAERFRRIVRTQLRQPLTVDALARQLGTSRATLYRAVKTAYDQSPTAFVEAQRMRQARLLLRETDHKILHVALECGYRYGQYFMRRFKEATGVTPGQFRKGGLASESDPN